ncbi:hypothetical protein EF888_15035 [Silicimonas algicola]|nr:hypothetical protein [Silicimonas algicola]AZQ68332.1 hypothetical protein EF888_15035 [Silicimonas algicola]
MLSPLGFRDVIRGAETGNNVDSLALPWRNGKSQHRSFLLFFIIIAAEVAAVSLDIANLVDTNLKMLIW